MGEIKNNMWQYLLYFLLGGSIVALVAYLANQGNQVLTILVGNLPVLFLLNIFLAYRVGGTMGGIVYARGALISLPFFIVFVLIVMLILPRVNTPLAVLPAMLVYIIPPFLYHRKKQHLYQGNIATGEFGGEGQVVTPVSPNLEKGKY